MFCAGVYKTKISIFCSLIKVSCNNDGRQEKQKKTTKGLVVGSRTGKHTVTQPPETRPIRLDDPSTSTHQAEPDLGQLHDELVTNNHPTPASSSDKKFRATLILVLDKNLLKMNMPLFWWTLN